MAKKFKLKISALAKKLDIITKKSPTGAIGGNYASVFKGTGIDFAGFRKYSQGDDVSLIDWKASLKSNSLLVRESEEERGLNLFFLVDVSSTMMFGSTDKLKCEYAAEVVGSIAFSVINKSDNIGLGMFNDKIVRTVYPAPGEKQYYKLLMNLVDFDLYGGGYDLAKALQFLVGYLPGESLLFVVSDFIGLMGDWQRYLKMCCHKFDVVGIMVRDPRDREMPEGVGDVVVSSPYTSERMVIHPGVVKEEYESYVRQQEDWIGEFFSDSGADFRVLDTSKSFVNPLIKMFGRRKLRFH